MKKQIAVLMAAATAVTTVAPALASASDVNTYDASVSEINAKIKNALNERYKDKNADGINASNANTVDDYLNSRYAVVVTFKDAVTDADGNGLKPFADTIYAGSKVENALTAAGSDFNINSNTFVVKDADKLQGLIESRVIGNDTNNAVKVAIVDKGIKDGAAVEVLKEKHYVNKVEDPDTQVSLRTLIEGLMGSENSEGLTYVDKLKVNDVDVTSLLNSDEVFDSANKAVVDANTALHELEESERKTNEIGVISYCRSAIEKSKTIVNGLANGAVNPETLDEATQSLSEAKVYMAKGVDGGIESELSNLINITEKAVGLAKKVPVSDISEVKLTLTSGKECTVKVNDKAFDLSKPVDKNGKELKLGNDVAQNVYDQVEGFKYQENKDNKEVTVVLPCGDTDIYTVQDVQASTVELGKIFTTKDGYTKDGADLVNGIIDARNYKNNSLEFNYNGINYTLASNSKNGSGNYAIDMSGLPEKPTLGDKRNLTNVAFDSKTGVPAPIIEKSGEGYVLRYNVRVVKSSDMEANPTILQFVVRGDSQKDLATVLDNLNGENTVVAGHFTRLEGADRYSTAIEVSKEKFDPQEANTVVIVGGEALMDGLSAVPLASVKNAPILLSHPKSGLNDATLNEISRACKGLNRKTVYVVGGENSVPEKAVKQLEDKFGAVVMRVSGSDRYDTSLEVARRLKYDGNTNETVYLAGGEGAADAMSVSPVAADVKDNKVSPVLVVPKDSVKRTTRDFITNTSGFKNGYIIGGESTVSSNVYRDLNNTNGFTLNRVAGSDRYDTNVQLLKKFYTNSGEAKKISVGGAIFTSGDTKFLVDAQTAGPLAASKNAPIVLTGSKLTNDQVNLLKNKGLLSGINTNVYQVGGVVSSDVMSVVVDKLGL